MTTPLKIDIWSDIACPWCYIGKRKFESGATLAGADVEIEYHSFELSPDTPVDFDGTEVEFLAGYKGMDAAQVEQMLGQVTAIANSVGLPYDFDALQHTNTVLAHELLHFAKANGRQLEMAEHLFKAYFLDGGHVGRVDSLVALAAEIGLDADAARAALEQHTYLDDVHADQAQAVAYGIQGVPFFVIDGRYGVSGAQSPEVFAQAITQANAERVAG